jgi:hypothetical protein
MKKDKEPTAFGVFKPVGHVVISFAPAIDVDAVVGELNHLGVDITRYSAAEMRAQIDEDLERAGVLASIGQEMNLIKAHRALAEEGYNWLVVRAKDDAEARRIARIADDHGAERAQYYGRLIIEELIQHDDVSVQHPESPQLDLDPETPSRLEKERAVLRDKPEGKR